MLDPNTSITVGQLTSILKDAAFFVGIPVLGWKARSVVQPAIDFFNEAKHFMLEGKQHMTKMEANMDMLLTNHLPHIQEELARKKETE